MRFISLFAGIGGLDLGLERAGWTCVAQVERDEFCQRVLAKHWPDVPRFGDIVSVRGNELPATDALVGGFPCQDISSASSTKRDGLRGKKSGLWREYLRLVGEITPRFVVVENSPRWQAWVPEVRADLSDLGYTSMCVVLSAGSCGAPHSRPRGFVVAHADGDGEFLSAFDAEVAAHADLATEISWADEPDYLRMGDGLPRRMDRLRALGNAVVPQVAEAIGRAILKTAVEKCYLS